jgi:pimeloyl-ACP methyl ester carboxylesterase
LRPRDEPAADEPDVIVSNLLNGRDQLTVDWLGNKNRSWLTNSDAEGIFDPLGQRLETRVCLDVRAWLTGPGPWDVPSVAAGLAGYLRRRYARPVLVCGHSTGGTIALQLAVSAPETVAGLLLVNTGAHMHEHGDVETILARVREEWGPDLRAAVLDRSFDGELEGSTRARMLAWSEAVPQQAVYDVLASQHGLDLTPQLGEITVPTVVLHGRRDRARSIAAAHELAAAIPSARLRLAPAGHTPVYETPHMAASAVAELLTTRRSGAWPS